jgi:choline dehydrogenase-like flavoprotein
MGTDGLAVVDPELRLHGIERLRICDASVMPRVTSSNTNAPTLMIAEKAADHILGGPLLPPARIPRAAQDLGAMLREGSTQ